MAWSRSANTSCTLSSALHPILATHNSEESSQSDFPTIYVPPSTRKGKLYQA